MIEAGEVGAVFRIVDEASPVLRRIMAEFERFEVVIKQVKASLDTFKLPPGVNTALGNMAKNFDKIALAADASAKGATAGLAKIDAALIATEGRVAGLAASLRAASAGMAQLRVGGSGGTLRARAAGVGGGTGGGHGGGGGVGVTAPGMHLPGGGSIHAHQGSDGFWELIGGAAIAEGVKKMLESNMEMKHLEAQAMATSATSTRIGDIMAASWKNAHDNMNVTATQSMRYILELTQVTGTVDEALKILSVYSSAKAALGSLKDEGMKEKLGGPSQLYGFARSLELLGVTQDPAKMDATSQAILREMIGMKGLVDGSSLFQAIQNAGGARYSWSTDFVEHALGPLVQASPRAGAGLYQFDRSLNAGVMTEMMADNLIKYGFFKEDDKYRDAHGRFKGMKTGSIAGYDEARANPAEWAKDVALPLLAKHGIDIADTNAVAKAVQEISRGNKNLGAILDEILLPGPRAQLEKERANIDAVDKNATGILQRDDPLLKMQALAAKWNDLMNSLGSPLTERAMAIVDGLTKGLDGLAQFFNAHPAMARIAADALVVASGLLLLSGSLAILKIALSGFSLFGIGAGAAAAGGVGAAGGAAGGAAAFGKGLLRKLGILGIVAGVTEDVDPNGDFGGLMKPIDGWFKKHIGFDPSNVELGKLFGGNALPAVPPVVDSMKTLDDGLKQSKSQYDAVAPSLDKFVAALGQIPGAIGAAIATLKGLASAAGAASPRQGNDTFRMHALNAPPPPTGGAHHTVQVQTALNVDGRELARATSTHVARYYTHPTQAPAPDSYLAYRSPDAGLVTT